jgi:hypothetical protein
LDYLIHLENEGWRKIIAIFIKYRNWSDGFPISRVFVLSWLQLNCRGEIYFHRYACWRDPWSPKLKSSLNRHLRRIWVRKWIPLWHIINNIEQNLYIIKKVNRINTAILHGETHFALFSNLFLSSINLKIMQYKTLPSLSPICA